MLEKTPRYTLRNADSYSYALAMYALYFSNTDKTYRPYWDENAKDIKLEKLRKDKEGEKNVARQEDRTVEKPLLKRFRFVSYV